MALHTRTLFPSELELTGVDGEGTQSRERTTSFSRKGSISQQDISDLLCHLHQYVNKWFNIGLYLKVNPQKLEEIRTNYPSNEDALREMLLCRLKQKLTWEMISSALKLPNVNGEVLYTPPQSPPAPSKSIATPVQYKLESTEHHYPSTRQPQEEVLRQPQEDNLSQATQISKHSIYRMEKMPLYANREPADFTFKVITVGDIGVGKTSTLQRFARALPCENTLSTVTPLRQGEYYRVVAVDNGMRVKLELWDTAGCEKQFASISESYFRKVDAALVMFDVSERRTFEHAASESSASRMKQGFKTWLKEVRYRLDDTRATVVILVGNKNDKVKRQVDSNEAKRFADKNKLDYVETSSKEDNNVDQLFFLACQRLLELNVRRSWSNQDVVINLTRSVVPSNQKSGCCRRHKKH